MNRTSIAIIVPTKHSGKVVKRLFISLQSQVFQNWRVIFVDGSDKNEEIIFLKDISRLDSRFEIVYEDKNKKGIYQAMNKGIKFIKKNEWVIFLGSDDWLSSPFALHKLHHQLNKEENYLVDMFIYKTKYVNPDSLKTSRFNNLPNNLFINRSQYLNLILKGYSPIHQSACFSGDLINKLAPYNINFYLAADLELFFRIFCLKEVNIKFIHSNFVNIAGGGESSKYKFLRLKETFNIYHSFFGKTFFIPLLLRYLRKIMSLR